MIRAAIILLLCFSTFSACLASPRAGEYTIRNYKVSDLFPEPRLQSLASAACSGDTRKVERLVEQGVDPNGYGEFRETALLWALHFRSLRGVKALLDSGADPEYHTVRAGTEIADPKYLEAILEAGGNASDLQAFFNASGFVVRRNNDWRHYDLLIKHVSDVNILEDKSVPDEFKATIMSNHQVRGHWCRAIDLFSLGFNTNLPTELDRLLDNEVNKYTEAIQDTPCYQDLKAELKKRVSPAELEQYQNRLQAWRDAGAPRTE